MFLSVRLVALLTVTIALTAATFAQDTGVESNLPGAGFGPQAESATPTIHVYSRETILDVLATDNEGRPVLGLQQSDFTVLEDGKPQPLRSFREYSVAGQSTPPPQLPPNTYTNAQALPISGPVQIFYFQMPVPAGRDADLAYGAILVRAKQYIVDYLRTMPAGTQVAIFAFLPDQGLHLVQPFTTNGKQAAAAMDSLVVQRIATPGGADRIAAADQIADYVAGIHGRKNLIWIGPPMPILRDGGYSWGASDMELIHRRMDTYDRFTKEQIAIYPLDPGGLPASPKGLPVALNKGSLFVEQIAEQTGGQAIYNTNDYKGAVAKIVDQSSHFYTLSYVPTRPDADGHFHPITIKVDRPGVHLTYRTGYNDEQPKPPDPVLKEHMVQGPMRLGALPSTQLLFTLNLEPAPAGTKDPAEEGPGKHPRIPHNATLYKASFLFDPTQLTYSESLGGKHTATLELDLGAYDSYMQLITTRSQSIKISLPPDKYDDLMRQPFRFIVPISLPSGKFTLRAGLFDTLAGAAGTLEVPVDLHKPAK
ncbi:MAG TPA: VWA domain-containing protein [Acidobacteriaceae bacterium]|nr:VWA domain-containing protein [Acidobacteriaceae bacterium]